jgi:hypothetical protein
MNQDEHGVWAVNYACQLPPMVEPYVFLAIVSQVRAHHDVGTSSIGVKKFHISHTIEHKICVENINIIQFCMLSECCHYQISICAHDK